MLFQVLFPGCVIFQVIAGQTSVRIFMEQILGEHTQLI